MHITRPLTPREYRVIAQSALFKGFDSARLHGFLSIWSIQQFSPNELLYRANEPADSMLLILSGGVDVSIDGAQVGNVLTGEIVGEMGYANYGLRSADVVASGASDVICLHAAYGALRSYFDERPRAASLFHFNLFAIVSQRLAAANTHT